MLLKIKQRLLLLNILPDNGNYDTLKIIRDQQAFLGITEDEHKRLKIKREGDLIQWDESLDEPVDIEIGEVAGHIIKRELRRLDSEGQLQMEFLPLYEHFVEGEEWSPGGVQPEVPTPMPHTTKSAMGSSPLAEGAQE